MRALALAVAAACAALPAAIEWVARRERHRVRRRLELGPVASAPVIATRLQVVGHQMDGLICGVGRRVRRLARQPDAAAADRRLGWGLLAGLVAVPLVGPWVAPGVVAGVVLLPALRERGHRARRARAIADGMPEVIELVRVGVGAGLDVGSALAAVADHYDHGPVAEALAGVCRRMDRGDRLIDALIELEGLGEPARALCAALVASLRHGVPLVPALDRAAAEARDTRRRRHEEAARALPVTLLFPLVFCTLPALVLLTVVPLLVRSFPSLTP